MPLNKIPLNQHQNIIIAGNFFRDYGIFTKAKECYSKILMKFLPVDIDELEPTEKTQNKILEIIKSKSKKNTSLAQVYKKNLDTIYLGYAYLLILENPLNADKASQYLYIVLANNPQHSFALWQLALSYESRGEDFFDKAIEFYSKAMLFDRRSTGRLSYEFGRFYFCCMNNLEKAKDYFEISIQQKLNLPACISMAELEFQAGNAKRAREFLKKGLALIPETRIQIEQREKLQNRIQILVENLIS